jgi:hypothetical protein
MAVSEEVKQLVQELRELDLKTATLDAVVTKLSEYPGKLPIIITHIPEGTFIYRCRFNESGEEEFHYPHEISYIKNPPSDLPMGRANNKGESMFYGVVPHPGYEDDKQQIDSLLESGLDELEPDEYRESEYTMGKWRVKSGFWVMAIPQYEMFHDNNKSLLNLHKAYVDFVKTHPDLEEDALYFMKYMAGEFAKKVKREEPWRYKVSVAFMSCPYSVGCPGLIYPSVKADGEGVNIVMEPRAVDDLLELHKVARWMVLSKGKDNLVFGRKIVLEYEEDGRFIWKEEGTNMEDMRSHFIKLYINK